MIITNYIQNGQNTYPMTEFTWFNLKFLYMHLHKGLDSFSCLHKVIFRKFSVLQWKNNVFAWFHISKICLWLNFRKYQNCTVLIYWSHKFCLLPFKDLLKQVVYWRTLWKLLKKWTFETKDKKSLLYLIKAI